MDFLEKHFDTAFSAPDGIKKLRELILTLAMQGKLVPQDPSDQPASELLKEIQKEKEKLIAEGKIKKQKPLPPIKPEEIPYELPTGWKWVRLGDIVLSNIGGGTPSKQHAEYWNGDIKWASVKDINSKYLTTTIDTITNAGLINSSSNFVKENTLIIVTRMGLGKLCINKIPVAINQDLRALYFSENIYNEFAYVYFKDTTLEGSGLTVKGIKQDNLMRMLYPLTSLTEQKRVVEKIDQLMARCDELEKLKKEQEQKRLDVHKSAIHRLINTDELNGSWSFIKENFSELYSVKENVAELRKAILSLAMQGKLVPQDPTDQPASELLKEIQKDKEKLIKEGKIKKQKPLLPIKQEVVPYELPKNWKWCKLSDCFIAISDGDHQAPPRSINGIPFLVIGNVSKGHLEFKYTRMVTEDYYNSLDWIRKPLQDDILYTVTGSFGIPIHVDKNIPFCVQRHIAILKKSTFITSTFYVRWLQSSIVLEQARERATGIAQKTVSLNTLRNIIIPLPPLAEQKRIVEKIDQLMALCDELEAQIDSREATQTSLLNSIMAQV